MRGCGQYGTCLQPLWITARTWCACVCVKMCVRVCTRVYGRVSVSVCMSLCDNV